MKWAPPENRDLGKTFDQKFGQKIEKTKLLDIDWNGEQIDQHFFLEMFDQKFYPWSFPSLLALVGVTTIATRLQRGVAPWSRSTAPARGRSMSDGFP